jgi:putative phosphoesterase
MTKQIIATIGVVADTHVPDRAPGLPAGLVEQLRAAQVSHILHAGDVCVPQILRELEKVAPVTAVRGNRDFLFSPPLPMSTEVELAGVRIGLVHGHGGWWKYWLDKFAYVFVGYRIDRYYRVALSACPSARVLVFGHSHRPENIWMDGRLVFNPGTVLGFHFGPYQFSASYGLLRIASNGDVAGQIIRLGSALPGGTDQFKL